MLRRIYSLAGSGFCFQLTVEMSIQQGNGGQALSGEEVMSEDEARKRREQLNRRPSYRMILKDLETADKVLKKSRMRHLRPLLTRHPCR